MKNKDIVMLKQRVSARTGVASLYLEMNRDGRRTYEFLHLYLNPGKDAATKAMNRSTLEAARTIQAERIVAIQRGEAQILAPARRDVLVTEYFEEYLRRHSQMSASHRKGMLVTLHRWCDYAGVRVRLGAVTPDMLLGFADYLRGEMSRYYGDKEEGRRKRTSLFLKANSIRTHYDRMVWVLRAAQKEGLIASNPADRVDQAAKPRTEKTERDYLTAQELQAMAQAPCPNPELKRAFLFACYTGLRHSDVYALTWANVKNGAVSLRMKKTGDPITVPLSDTAARLLGEPGAPDQHPFSTNSERQMYRDLKTWAKNAGVDKHVTFHVSRHTFATLALTYGADLYTVSKLLGHSNIRTTQVYAQIVDKKKEQAVKLIPDFGETL